MKTSSMSTTLAPASSDFLTSVTAKAPATLSRPLLATQSDLRLRAFGALQCERLVAHPAQSRDLLCQNGRDWLKRRPASRPRVRGTGMTASAPANSSAPASASHLVTGDASRDGRETSDHARARA